MAESYFNATTYNVQYKLPRCASDREHRLMRLPNGLLCLLVSDPRFDKVSTALCVACGSFRDPDSLPGLAHLCEHMLFMGTKEYPGPSLYFESIQKNGGACNAYTMGQKTCFQFEVPLNFNSMGESEFYGILQNFASFFKSPKFSSKYLKGEINIIENEHRSNITSEEKVLFHGLRILANKNHLFSRFSTGNSTTLKFENGIRSILSNYYSKYYKAENMSLVICGPQSVNQLQKFVVSCFSGIPSSIKENIKRESPYSQSLPKISILEDSWNDIDSNIPIFSEFQKIVGIKSNTTTPRIQILWTLKLSKHIKLWVRAWCSLLGDESIGSISRFLSDNYYSTLTYAYSQTLSQGTEAVILEISLSYLGSKNVHRVIAAALKFIEVLVSSDQFQLRIYLEELSTVEKVNFFYSDAVENSMEEASRLAELLHEDLSENGLGATNILRGYSGWEEFENNDFSRISIDWWDQLCKEFRMDTESNLTIDNVNVIILDKDFATTRYLSSSIGEVYIDQFYQFEFIKEDLDVNKITQQMCHIDPSRFSLPEPNVFLDFSSFEINKSIEDLSFKSGNSTFKYTTVANASMTEPTLIDHPMKHETWHKFQDLKGFESRVIASCDLISTKLDISPKSCISIEVICNLIEGHLRATLYASEILGFTWSIFTGLNNNTSIAITVTGLKNGFKVVLEKVFLGINLFLNKGISNVPYKEFMKARVNVRKKYENLMNSSGMEKTEAGFLHLLEEYVWSLEERFEALEELDFYEVVHFAQQFASENTKVTMFLHGDLNCEEARQMASIVQNKEWSTDKYKYPSGYLIQQGKKYIYSRPASQTDSTNTISLYVQIGLREDHVARTYCKLLSFLLGIVAPGELRTERQLGYTILTGQKIFRATVGVYITILGSDHRTQYLISQTEDFLFQWGERISSLSEQDFQENIVQLFLSSYPRADGGFPPNIILSTEAEIGSGTRPGGELYLEHKSYWEKILNRTYRFLGVQGEEEIDIDIIKKLKKEHFIKFYRENICPRSPTRSSLILRLDCSHHTDEDKENVYHNLTRKGLESNSDSENIANEQKLREKMYELLKAKWKEVSFSLIKTSPRLILGGLNSGKRSTLVLSQPKEIERDQFQSECFLIPS